MSVGTGMRSGCPDSKREPRALTTLVRPNGTEALDQSANAFVFSSGGDSLVDVEEDGECLVARPSLAYDSVNAFPQPPRACRVAQVVAAEPGKLRLSRIPGREIGA